VLPPLTPPLDWRHRVFRIYDAVQYAYSLRGSLPDVGVGEGHGWLVFGSWCDTVLYACLLSTTESNFIGTLLNSSFFDGSH